MCVKCFNYIHKEMKVKRWQLISTEDIWNNDGIVKSRVMESKRHFWNGFFIHLLFNKLKQTYTLKMIFLQKKFSEWCSKKKPAIISNVTSLNLRNSLPCLWQFHAGYCWMGSGVLHKRRQDFQKFLEIFFLSASILEQWIFVLHLWIHFSLSYISLCGIAGETDAKAWNHRMTSDTGTLNSWECWKIWQGWCSREMYLDHKTGRTDLQIFWWEFVLYTYI